MEMVQFKDTCYLLGKNSQNQQLLDILACNSANRPSLSGFEKMVYTLKTGIPVEEGDSILKLLRRVSRLEIQPPLLLSTVMEFTFQVRSKLLTSSLRKLATSSFSLNFLECIT